MSDLTFHWLIYVVLGGGGFLLVGWLLLRGWSQPIKRQWVGEWCVIAALALIVVSFAPSWWSISWRTKRTVAEAELAHENVLRTERTDDPESRSDSLQVPLSPRGRGVRGEGDRVREKTLHLRDKSQPVSPSPLTPLPRGERGSREEPPPTPPYLRGREEAVAMRDSSEPSQAHTPLLDYLFFAYVLGMCYQLLRDLRSRMVLRQLLAQARPASESELAYLHTLSDVPKKARILITPKLQTPFSCGVLRPTIVIPESLLQPIAEPFLRCVMIHEITHVRRRDALWGSALRLGRIVLYFVPWFWWIARQVRLSQEQLADAEVVRETGSAEDYADFLLNWKASTALPLGATGALGHSTDLFRRISMLMNQKQAVVLSLPRRWSITLVCSLLAIAVAIAGLSLAPKAIAQDPEKNPPADKTKDTPKDHNNDDQQGPENGIPGGFPDLENLFPKDFGQFPGNLDPQKMLEMHRKQIEEMRKLMQQNRFNADELRKRLQQGGAGFQLMPLQNFPGFPRNNARRGRLDNSAVRMGTSLSVPSAVLTDQLELPMGQGMVIEEVQKDSPADKAGLKAYDILLQIDGKMVPSNARDAATMINEIAADKEISVVVLRKGKNETIKGLKLPEAKKQDRAVIPRRGGFRFPNIPQLAPGANSVSNSIRINGNDFTSTRRSGDLTIQVTGKLVNNAPEIENVEITEAGAKSVYKSLKDVPEQHRNQVEKMMPNNGLRRGRNLRID